MKKDETNEEKRAQDLILYERAKAVLIESLGYTENQAHKYLEKRAMNERKLKKEIAMEILKTYGL